jgi:hypothetical protein
VVVGGSVGKDNEASRRADSSDENGFFTDNRDYPRSAMPDALCCWVFHVPPTLDYARAAVGIAPSRDGTFRTGFGPRPPAIGYVAKGWIAAFRRNDTSLRQTLDDIA